MRKHYIDNVRNLTILLLFPVHTFIIWNDFGAKFYIWGGENKLLSTLIVLVNPWFMPILFAIAGISARYSLKKRSAGKFIHERVNKLLIPFILGMILLVPGQTLYARKFYYHYKGGYLENLKYFFTHFSDLSGYDGGFTPGHLWFILFLFLVSLLSLIIIKYLPYEKTKDKVNRINIWGVIGLFIPVWLMYYVGNFGGFSIGKSLALYLAGYYVLSNDCIMEKLKENIKWIMGIYIISTTVLVLTYYQYSYYGDLLVNFTGWMGILVFLVLGNCYLNKKTALTEYFNAASFPIYILHQTILVVIGYYVLLKCHNIFLQVLIICGGSFALTILCYQIIKNITRKLAL